MDISTETARAFIKQRILHVKNLLLELENIDAIQDKRALALAKTHLETASMWATASLFTEEDRSEILPSHSIDPNHYNEYLYKPVLVSNDLKNWEQFIFFGMNTIKGWKIIIKPDYKPGEELGFEDFTYFKFAKPIPGFNYKEESQCEASEPNY